jgi:uncharacterized protein with PIN domain/sulfur carrier protein ThiS
MPQVTFRFYAELNDFLPRERRRQAFERTVDRNATVKDSIESLGVPHPEVDLVTVNGRTVDFACRLSDGDRVAVYPRFHGIDPGSGVRLSAEIPTPARFATDVHLRQLAHRLRLAGFDTVEVADDADLARRANEESRIALTRDRELLKRRIVGAGRWIRHTDPDGQLVEVLRHFELADEVAPFTRCLRCNDRLEPVAKARVLDRVPPGIPPLFDDFHQCPACRRVYWRGSHFDRLERRLQNALALAARHGPGV